ncbi:sensor domain-containing diguanylate cyclase [Nocardia panacis]|uniref:Sensor domain-containing diguanylate cyclase n=1 Tax=Nocardia panacis TaxID=2340916 RepID=A0A3A4KUJ7_9NOCA|nr:sensor domain-containing diguanylate cyclase [Nocardia panacis]RJO80244.1 sensor domain-containing diguanylate cyclase [Nocardia panacis]
MPVAPSLQVLTDLTAQLADALDADRFDAGTGTRVGAALVTAHLTDSAVPGISAQVLYRLAEHSARPDAGLRLAVLLTEIGCGFQARLHEMVCPSRPSTEGVGRPTRRDAEDRFRIVFDNAAFAIALGDTNGTLLDANRGLAEMIGVPVDQLRGISVYDFAHPDDRDEIRSLVYEKLVPAGAGTVKLDRRLIRADGSSGWISFAITYVKGIGGPDHLLAVGADVTDRHLLAAELHRQARHDPLTGLPNRRHLLERIQSAIASAGEEDRIGLCFADLDHFKHVNDRYGHGAGDQVLTAVATRLHDSVRDDGDCMIARIGGDEFVALIPPPVDDRRVAIVAERLLASLAEPITVGDHSLRISASIGAALTPVADARPESLLAAADTCLYHAKSGGTGRWVLASP